jgi:hypothetical protein
MTNESKTLSLQSLVEAIFTKCILRYGRDFTGRWEGLDLADVKADWAHELEGVKPETVRHGLKNLPDKPPTVKDFINACKGAPEIPQLKLDAPNANPELVRECLAKARAALGIA